MNAPKPLFAAIFIIAGIAVWYFGFRSSEEEKIRQRLEELSDIVSSPPEEGLLGKAKIFSSFEDLFANPVAIDTRIRQAQGVRTPKELAATYLALTQSGQTLTLSFKSPTITFPTEKTAKIETEATASVSRSGEEENKNTRQLIIILQQDEEGNWKFERFSDIP